MSVPALVTFVLALASPSAAGGGYPPTVEGVTIIPSKLYKNVTISFKEPGICETTPGVGSYSGYVHLPAGFLEDQAYPINTFFWFFEARNQPESAPLVIWLNGGAGASSMMGLLEELGPCTVGQDSATTILNPFSWNNNANLIFIDQPNQVGFSYDIPTNGTQVPRSDRFGFNIVPGESDSGGAHNLTTNVGTFSTQIISNTANSTMAAANHLWNFLQIWLSSFPHYWSSNERMSLWTESYGGHYGPEFSRFFLEQNKKIRDPSRSRKGGLRPIKLSTLGIISGLYDVAVQAETGIHYAYNNSYGIPLINQTTHASALDAWSRPNGGRDLLLSCRHAISHHASNTSAACNAASDAYEALSSPLSADSRGIYDLTHPLADPFPPPHLHGYLRQESVLAALGVPVNYSASSPAVGQAFTSTFDWMLGGHLDNLAYLLDNGVSVHLLHGDRDPSCEWRGGERASLAVPWERQKDFARAGYAALTMPGGEVKGMTRQLGNFSFTRVFQAGHEIPAYQPEAALVVFERAMSGRDVATGRVKVRGEYATEGPRDIWHVKNEAEEMPKERCYILKPLSCNQNVWNRILKGEVKVKDYYVVEEEGERVEGAEGMGDL